VPDADSLLATGWTTASGIAELPRRCGRKFFFVQDYEHWLTGGVKQRREIKRALRAAPSPIAPSQGALEMLAAVGRSAVAEVPLGLELDDFGVDIRPEDRNPLNVGFPFREESFKGSLDAIHAFEALRDRIPDLHVECFGSIPRPPGLPAWIGYQRSPDDAELRRFYNRLAVFLLPSRAEGWSLVAAEAMRCGAAVVTATWGRLSESLRDGEVARVVPVSRPEAMARVIDELIRCHRHRCELARAGARASDDFGWGPSVDRLENLLESTAKRGRG
jgi:glycosyltransferase involved in cell wall biosynthesis